MFLIRLCFIPLLLPLGLAAFALALVAFFATPMIAGPTVLVFGTLAVIFVFFFGMRHCDVEEWCNEVGEVTRSCCEYMAVGSLISCYVVCGSGCEDD
jgi:peptidoglycan/LPS O-acetylase OafA/YrhL